MVIDCPPALGLLTVNALVASTHLLIPIQSSYFALEGTDDLLETIEKVRARANTNLRILGVAITMHDKRTALARDIRNQIDKVFGTKVFRKPAMGFGDVKMFSAMGGVLGFWCLLALGVGAFAGALIGIVVRLATKERYVPFGPVAEWRRPPKKVGLRGCPRAASVDSMGGIHRKEAKKIGASETARFWDSSLYRRPHPRRIGTPLYGSGRHRPGRSVRRRRGAGGDARVPGSCRRRDAH